VDYDNGTDGQGNGGSIDRPYKTVKYAYDMCRTNKNDVICLSAYSAHSLAAMLTVSKNRVHFVGLDGFMGRGYGQGAKIGLGNTVAASGNTAMITNTGVRNSFRNIKFSKDNATETNAITTFAEGGEYTAFANCEFYNAQNLNSDTVSELLLNGDSAQFFNCTFGSLADAVSGDKIRPAVRLAKGLVGTGLVTRDGLFQNCRFWKQAGGTTTTFVYAVNATDVERVLQFDCCTFMASKLGSTPAQAIKGGATLTVGNIIATYCSAFNVTKLSTTTGVLVHGGAPNSGTGIGVNAA
jgi:hypothetical protein